MKKTILLLTILLSFTSMEAGSVQCQGVTLAGAYCRNMVAKPLPNKGPFCTHHNGNNLNKLSHYYTEEYKEAKKARKIRELAYPNLTPLEKVYASKEEYIILFVFLLYLLVLVVKDMIDNYS